MRSSWSFFEEEFQNSLSYLLGFDHVHDGVHHGRDEEMHVGHGDIDVPGDVSTETPQELQCLYV